MVLAALLGALLVTGAGAEVQLFVDKQTVRVDDPQLGEKSILNDFNPKGYRTHNYLALAWNDMRRGGDGQRQDQANRQHSNKWHIELPRRPVPQRHKRRPARCND